MQNTRLTTIQAKPKRRYYPKADIQPYSGGRAREQYGLDIECQMRMFCDMSDDVKVGNRVEYDGDIYDITYVQKWDSGLVAMLERSRLK